MPCAPLEATVVPMDWQKLQVFASRDITALLVNLNRRQVGQIKCHRCPMGHGVGHGLYETGCHHYGYEKNNEMIYT